MFFVTRRPQVLLFTSSFVFLFRIYEIARIVQMLKFVKSLGKKSPGSRRSSQDKGGKRSQSVCLENDENLKSLLNGNNVDGHDEPVYVVRDKELGKLHKAAWYGHLDKVKILAKRDPSVFDKCHRTPLHLACCRGYAGIVQELLAWNARTSVGDKESKTPLMKAVECGHADVVEVLLSYQVDGEARDGAGDTSLHLAIKYQHLPIINALLKAGTNPNLKNMEGKTPLHYAILKQDLKITDILLKNKADVNAIDTNQRTPLMFACHFGLESIISLLVKKGASITVKDSMGWTASDHAIVKGHQSCMRLLERELRQQQDEDLLKDSTDDSPSAMPTNIKRQNSKVSSNTSQIITGGFSAHRRASMSPMHLVSPTPMCPAETNAEDSGDETVTVSSHCSQGKDAGSDSWADDTDISFGMDDKKGKSAMRVSLAKFMPQTSDSETVEDGYAELNFKNGASNLENNPASPTKKQEDKGNASLMPRKGRVSFKEDNEITEVFTSFSTSEKMLDAIADPEPIYATVNKPKKLTVEQQRAFMAELGFSDNDDLTDGSAPIYTDNQILDTDEQNSDWDTTPRSQSEQMSTIKLVDHEVEDSVFYPNDTDKTEDFQTANDQNTPDVKSSEMNASEFCPPIPPKLSTSRRESVADEDQFDMAHVTETEVDESDWDSPAPSVQPTPRNEEEDEYFQRTSSLRRMNMAASKIMTLSNESPEYIDMYIGEYKSAYEEAVNLGVVDDVASDNMAKSQIMQELDKLLEANAAVTDHNEPGAKDKLLEAARTVTERINQMIDVCSGEIRIEDEIKATDSLEAQVKEDILELVGCPSLETIGELRQTYLYKPDSLGNVVDDGDDDSTTSGNASHRMPSASPSPVFSDQRLQNQIISPTLNLSTFKELDEKEESDNIVQEDFVENLHSSLTKDYQMTEPPKEPQDSNGIIAKKDDDETDDAILKSVPKLENWQKLTSTPKPTMTDFSSPPKQHPDLINTGNGLRRKSVLASPQKTLCTNGSEMFAEGLSGLHYLDSSDILKDDDLMSLTSTENESNQILYGKDTLMNLNLNDSTSIAKIQEHLQEGRQKLDKEKNQRTLIENQYRILQEENNKLVKKIQALSQEKSSLEETKLSLEAKIRNLQFQLTEEADKSKVAEILHEQSKKQLEKIDQQYKKDFEIKQQTEMELKCSKDSLETLETENRELKTLFKDIIQERNLKQEEQLQQHMSNQQADKEEVSKIQLEKTREFLLKIEELQLEKRQTESALQDYKHKHELEQHALVLEKCQLQESIAKIQNERDKLQENYIQVQVQYESYKQEMSKEKELQRNAEQSFQTQIQEMENQNQMWKEEMKREQEANKELKECLSSLKIKIVELENQLKNTESTLKRQTIQLEDAQQTQERFERENGIQLSSLQDEKKNLEKDLHNLEIKKSGLEIELHHEKNKVNMLQKDLDMLQQNNFGKHGALVQELQLDNAKLVAEVRHEKEKSDLLQQHLHEEQNARYTLDANLKEANLQLQNKIMHEEIDEDVEPLLYKTNQVNLNMMPKKVQLEEDNKPLKEALQQQKKMENNFEAELEKNRVLQSEVDSLKSSLKDKKAQWVANLHREKKRLKMITEKEKQKAREAIERKNAVEVLLEAEVEKNHVLQCEIIDGKKQSALQASTLTRRSELDSSLRTELDKKLEEVNAYLEQQHQEYDVKMEEKENRWIAEKTKLQEEILQLRLNFEKALFYKDEQAKEALRFRNLYHQELSLKELKGSLQPQSNHLLYVPASMTAIDPSLANNTAAFKLWERPGASLPPPDTRNGGPKSPGVTVDSSSMTDAKFREMLAHYKSEMHKTIKSHLEAPPYDNPVISTLDKTYPSPVHDLSNKPFTLETVTANLTKSKVEYLELLNRKYCL